MKSKYILNYCTLIIFISLIFSLIYGNYNLKKFDKNIITENNKSLHLMIKNDPLRYFSHGYEIKEQLKNNTNYFETGRNNFTKYLYPRIIALYYYFFDYDLYENSKKKEIKTGIHKNFLFLQIVLYYLSVFFFYFQLKRKIENKYLFFTLLFLCIEPTLFQYHGSFWSESIFFSFQILIMGMILSNNFSNLRLIILGIVLSFLALQRSNGFYYLIPVIIYFYFSKDFRFFYKILFLLIGFSFLISLVSFHNYKKSGKFSIVPLETKSVLHAYVIPNLLDKNGLKLEKEKFFDMIEEENILIDNELLKDINYARYSFKFCQNTNDKKNGLQYLRICKYFHERSKEIIISNPLKFIKFVSAKSLSFVLLNPFHIYSDHRYFSGESYYNSDLHNKLKNYRIFYSLIIYLICFIGLIELYRKRENKILLYVVISCVYFFGILSWHGNNRYFTPILIYSSILFGYGINFILNFFNKKKFINS